VRLAFHPAAHIESPEGIRYFSGLGDTNQSTWSSQEEDAQPLFNQPCAGELSVSYNPFIHVSWDHESCDSAYDPGRENEWGGEYGPHQFEDFAVSNSSTTTIYFTMSTWNPYTVVLMRITLEKTQ
jgi:hypothetical protein